VIAKQPAEDLDKVSAATALTGTPAALNFLTNLATVVAAVPAGDFALSRLLPGKIHYGQFLFASPLMHSANTGFNFSPSRDMSEAVFWNPSAIAGSRKPGNVNLLTNLKNNIKTGGYWQLNKKISLGGGFIYTVQDEFLIKYAPQIPAMFLIPASVNNILILISLLLINSATLSRQVLT